MSSYVYLEGRRPASNFAVRTDHSYLRLDVDAPEKPLRMDGCATFVLVLLVSFQLVVDRAEKSSMLAAATFGDEYAITDTEASICEYCRPHFIIEEVQGL